MDNAVKRAEEAFEDLKNEMFQIVLSEIYEASKIYDDVDKNSETFLTTIERNARSNIIAINEAKEALNFNDANSVDRLKRLLAKQSIYDLIKEEFLKEKVQTK